MLGPGAIPGDAGEAPRASDAEAQRCGEELARCLLAGIAEPQELRVCFLAASAWSALLEACVASSQVQERALQALPLAPLRQQLLWSVARMDFSDMQAQKI